MFLTTNIDFFTFSNLSLISDFAVVVPLSNGILPYIIILLRAMVFFTGQMLTPAFVSFGLWTVDEVDAVLIFRMY